MNVADLLTRQAIATPDRTALIHREQAFTYAEFEALVWGLCRHFRDGGLQQGEVVGLHLDDPLLHFSAVWAMARMGLVAVAVKAAGSDIEAGRSILARTGVSAVVDANDGPDWRLPTRVRLHRDQLPVLAAGADERLRSDRPDQLLHFKTSSGTTAAPKIIGATHAGMVASIEREIACVGYPAGERYLTPVSLTFDGPRRRYMACLASGGTAVLPSDRGELKSLIATIDLHDVRHFSCVPSQAYELAAVVGSGRQRFPQMRCLRISAAPSDASLHRLLRERLTSNVLISYGCTELGPLAVATPDMVANRPQAVGRPMPGIVLEIVSADGQLLPPDAVGLIRVCAEGMPQAYHDDPVATAEFFRNGWFYPGDLGKTNEEGLLFHMGRADGMMIMNGINIYPAEIEQAMMSHPAVRDAVAMPLKHRVANEVPVCAVVLGDNEQVSERELLVFARSRLGSHSPQRVAILGQIPRNEHGKVQRPALLEAVASRLDVGRGERNMHGNRVQDRAGCPLRQLALSATVSFGLPERLDLRALDAWLYGLLHLEVPDLPDEEDATQRGLERKARAWLERSLLLARLLLQAARIPVFDAPKVIALNPDQARSDKWHASVVFARVEEMPAAAYDIAFNGAIQLGTWAMVHPLNDRNLQAFYTLVQERVTSRLQSMVPRGKSTLPVLRAAHRKSIPFTHLGAGVFQLGWGRKAQRIDRSVTGRDSAIGAKLSGDKALTAKLLSKAGLPAPVHKVAMNLEAALSAAREIGWPVVVKPGDRERGEGVMVDVGDEDQLKRAFESAFALSRSKKVIVERQVDGVCHRLLMANGRLLYAVKRLPMSIEGDGVADVAALIDAEVGRQLRRPPWERSGIQPVDDLARTAIARAGYTLASVPAKGTLVPLRRIESTEWGGVDVEVTLQIHPENLRVARAASELFGLGVAGIDIITGDITRPWFENGAIVNEVNFAPLLGGADISRSYLPAFLDEFIDGAGTIPVEVFVGGEAAWAAAMKRWQDLVASGIDACLSHANRTLAPSGEEWPMPFTGLYRRTRALVLSSSVQALVLVVQTDEFLMTGMPLETVSTITVVDHCVNSSQVNGDAVSRERMDSLLEVLQAWRKDGGA